MDDWNTATVGCDRSIEGTRVGDPMSCTIEGLDPATPYEIQLTSFETRADGTWGFATYSNNAAATASGP